jgi:hypothetical protein
MGRSPLILVSDVEVDDLASDESMISVRRTPGVGRRNVSGFAPVVLARLRRKPPTRTILPR